MLGGTARAAVRALRRPDVGPAAGSRAGRPSSCPIVLVHGFLSSSHVLLPLERHLGRTLGRPIVRVALGARVPLHLQDVRKSARRVHETIEALARMPGFEFADIVGHSLGGLVASYVLKRLDRGKRVRRVVTLGAPHRGTPLAWLGLLVFGAVSRAIWQMLPGAPLLRELEALPVPRGSEIVALASSSDGVVPARFARVDDETGQRNLSAPPARHLELVFAGPVLGLVSRVLAA
jgi:triacylglycerol lipase